MFNPSFGNSSGWGYPIVLMRTVISILIIGRWKVQLWQLEPKLNFCLLCDCTFWFASTILNSCIFETSCTKKFTRNCSNVLPIKLLYSCLEQSLKRFDKLVGLINCKQFKFDFVIVCATNFLKVKLQNIILLCWN